MAIVDFEQIERIDRTHATRISPDEIAMGPISGGTRTSLCDPDWGYFLFGQNLTCEYRENDTYFDVAEFTITGVFTIHAEDALSGNEGTTEDAKFSRVTAKYELLEALIRSKTTQEVPDDFSQWGTSSDPRCIALPRPLLDKDGNRIYALPISLDVQQGQWGNFIQYRCVLREAKRPPGKVIVNDRLIDDGVITIQIPTPIMSRTQLAGCTGESIQVRNYTVTSFEVSGTSSGPPPAEGRTLTDHAHDLMRSLIADKVNIGVARIDGQSVVKDVLWPNLSTDEGCTVEAVHRDQICTIAVRARAGKP